MIASAKDRPNHITVELEDSKLFVGSQINPTVAVDEDKDVSARVEPRTSNAD